MKNVFIVVNLVVGMLGLVLGLAAILNESHNLAGTLVGGISVALAVICLWMAEQSSDGKFVTPWGALEACEDLWRPGSPMTHSSA